MTLFILIIALLAGLIGSALVIVLAISVFIGVPFLPTHRRQARVMMDLAGITPGTRVVDLGSGAGRLLFLAAARGATAVGYELNPFLYTWTKLVIFIKGLTGRVDVKLASLYSADVTGADVVFAFLFPGPMVRLEKKLFSEMKPGAKIISYTFSIPGRTPVIKEQGIFVYQV